MTRETNLRNWFNFQVPILIKLTVFLGCDLINSHKLSGKSFVNMFSGSPWPYRDAPWSDGGKLPGPASQDLSLAPWLTFAWCSHLWKETYFSHNVLKICDHKRFHKTLWVYIRVSDVWVWGAKKATKIEPLSINGSIFICATSPLSFLTFTSDPGWNQDIPNV